MSTLAAGGTVMALAGPEAVAALVGLPVRHNHLQPTISAEYLDAIERLQTYSENLASGCKSIW